MGLPVYSPCHSLKLHVQTIGAHAVTALLALDFFCPSCFLDLGVNDTVNISLYRFNVTKQVRLYHRSSFSSLALIG